MTIIGITGSIGMGKSTIASMFKQLQIPVFDSDKEVSNILENNKTVKNKLYKIWPETIIYQGNTKRVNKVLLSEIIFTNDENRKMLETIIHPLVNKKRELFIKMKKKTFLIALDVPLLYETGTDKICDDVFLAITSDEKQKERVLSRPNMTEKKFILIKRCQWTNKKKKEMKPYLVDTSFGKIISFTLIIVYLIEIIFKRKVFKL